MKKLLGLILVSGLILSSIISVSAFELSILDIVRMQVTNLTGKSFEFGKSYPLYDIDGNYSYDLYEFKSGGYTIATHQNGYISELIPEGENPYKNVLNYKIYYMGPYNYLYEINNQKYEANSKVLSRINLNPVVLDNSKISIIRKMNNEVLSEEVNLISPRGDNVWHGTDSSRFIRYKNWINTNNTCGPHSAAVMLAYLDDYKSDSIVASDIRQRGSENGDRLINVLTNRTPNVTSTLPGDVYTGINYVLNNKTNYKADYTTIGSTWTRTQREVNLMGCLCVGLASILGSKYGNHWVTVYQYLENKSNKGYYQCHDNQGSYNTIIQTSWTIGTAWVENK